VGQVRVHLPRLLASYTGALREVEAEGETIEIVLSGPKLPDDTESLQADLEKRLGYRPDATLRMVTSEIKELD